MRGSAASIQKLKWGSPSHPSRRVCTLDYILYFVPRAKAVECYRNDRSIHRSILPSYCTMYEQIHMFTVEYHGAHAPLDNNNVLYTCNMIILWRHVFPSNSHVSSPRQATALRYTDNAALAIKHFRSSILTKGAGLSIVWFSGLRLGFSELNIYNSSDLR